MRGIILTFFLIFFTQIGKAQDYNVIRSNLEQYVNHSIANRKAVVPTAQKYGFESYKMDSLNQLIYFKDSLHLQYVVSVLNEHGWLGISEIGKKANLSLFLAVQNSKNDPVRERYFPLLKASAEKQESSLAQMATMQDRIWISKKKPQMYGTQWNYIGDQSMLYPLMNGAKINDFRKSVGLAPLSEEDIKLAQSKFQ
jgi:hypothetical protein